MDTDGEHSEQQSKQSRWGFRGKTVWNWLELLIVPLALAVIGLAFSVQQDARQQRVENQRAEAERELAVQRAQDETLQAYLDQMSTLMLEKDLRNSDEDSEVRTLARARTLTVLKRLDASRRAEIMQFLLEADLVRRVGGSAPVIELESAHLRDTSLVVANLSGAALKLARLSGAALYGADLSEADLSSADLSKAGLSGYTDLSGANLLYADLRDADLRDADLRGANLNIARLRGADLRNADLTDANLRGADLRGAELRGAVLRETNLRDAKGVTKNELDQAESLEDATMPNGQKY